MNRILIVDDRADNLYILRALLQGHGYAVDEAAHGADALALAREQRPEIVVSDLLMPVMDGYQLLREWKADAGLRGIPFVVYTATYTDPRDEQLALDLGADAFLVKPAEPEAFLAVIEQVLEAASAGRVAPPAATPSDNDELLMAYNATLVRKLERRALQLERRVAERDQALQALRANEVEYHAVFDNTQDMILLTSPDGRVHGANPAACKAFGLNEAQICERGRAGLIDPGDVRLTPLQAERARRGRAAGELTFVRGDGTRFEVELSSSTYHDGEGQVRISIIGRDISARRAGEAALKASYARIVDLQAALDAHAMVALFDTERRFIYVNDKACASSGYAREELIGQRREMLDSGVHPPGFFDAATAAIAAGQAWKGEVCTRAKGGRLIWADTTVVPFVDESGRLYQLAVIRTDISDRKRAEAERRELEAQLRDVQKLQAVGTLASGIAHDFNNIVGAVLGYAALARLEPAAVGPLADYLRQIELAGQRARSMVQRILGFSRPQPANLASIALAAQIDETVALLRATVPAIVTLQTRLPAETLHALADGTQLQQLLLNLCTNAWHAMGGSTGLIEIGLEAVQFDAATRPAELPPGPYAHLWVRDNGCGMDAATRERIFEPFYTTKPAGQGTGLGLAAVRGIMGAHHGAITVDSELGKGSTFHLYFPLVKRSAEFAPEAAAALAPAGAVEGRHVLYVDDDETMALLAERLLSRAGCRVTTFGDAFQALAAVRSQPREYDIVVTDYNMPRLSGLDLAAELQAVCPKLPVIISSGNVDEALRTRAGQLGVQAVLNKERLVEDLLPLVLRVLSAAGASGLRPAGAA